MTTALSPSGALLGLMAGLGLWLMVNGQRRGQRDQQSDQVGNQQGDQQSDQQSAPVAAIPLTDQSVRASAERYVVTAAPLARVQAIAVDEPTGSPDGVTVEVTLIRRATLPLFSFGPHGGPTASRSGQPHGPGPVSGPDLISSSGGLGGPDEGVWRLVRRVRRRRRT
jgi:hypothetical protein